MSPQPQPGQAGKLLLSVAELYEASNAVRTRFEFLVAFRSKAERLQHKECKAPLVT